MRALSRTNITLMAYLVKNRVLTSVKRILSCAIRYIAVRKVEVGRRELQNLRQIISLLEEVPHIFSRRYSASIYMWETSFRVSRRRGGERGEGRASCYPEDAPRWEKGHRVALSSGSSVSEDVWTLIKMCRASGRVPFLSFILPLASPLPSSRFILRAAASCARGVLYACDRTQTESPATFKERTGTVTWTAAARSCTRGVYARCRRDMRPGEIYVVTSCHRPTTDRQAPPFETRNTWLCLRWWCTLDKTARFSQKTETRSRRHCDPRASRRKKERSIGFDSGGF